MHTVSLNMWKCVPRRARELERANHFDKRGPTQFTNCNFTDEKNKRLGPPCDWFRANGCWGSNRNGNNTNNDSKWNFQNLTSSWLNAITWSGALVFGWYTSQLIHLKYKIYSRCNNGNYPPTLLSSLHPYFKPVKNTTESLSKIEKLVSTFTPTVHLVSNEKETVEKSVRQDSASSSSGNHDSSDDLMGEVLNSIENKLGLAAIENGQLKDGLNLLRSAAKRNYAPAQYNLGICYELGLGVAIDEKAAMELFRSAATLEHPAAMYNLGIYYGQGRGGLTRDTITATRLLRLAAVQGNKDAINALKHLDCDLVEPQMKASEWSYLYNFQLPTNNNIMPIPSTLLIDNVNYVKPQNNEGTVF